MSKGFAVDKNPWLMVSQEDVTLITGIYKLMLPVSGHELST